MTVQLRLEPKLQNKLALTPELKVGLELLQLPQIELEQRIDQEIETNPLLEWAPPETKTNSEIWRTEGTNFARSNENRAFDFFEQTVAHPTSLSDHLYWQIDIGLWPAHLKAVAHELVPKILPSGLLTDSDEDLARQLQVTPSDIAQARAKMQTLEPIGVAARSLRECLLIQLQDMGCDDSLAAKMLIETPDELAAQNWQAVADFFAVSLADVERALKQLRKLNPEPGFLFQSDTAEPIVPELLIQKNAADVFSVELYQPFSRRVQIGALAREFKQAPERFSSKEQTFIRERLRSAEFFLNSLKQRELTLLRVAEVLVQKQTPMLIHGPQAIVPLTLKDVGMITELHESTISRVTKNKYAITPHGLWELKAFFCHSVGGNHTAQEVKQAIVQLIAAEAKQKPMSDEAISQALVKAGMDVARRTVAKYRVELGIAGKSERKIM